MSFFENFGADCAGAIVFSPTKSESNAERDITSEIDKWLSVPNGEYHKSLFSTCRARLSIAGAQDKVPCIAKNGRYMLPASGIPTTHIVKPASHYFPWLPENEAFCLRLARICGLPATECQLDFRHNGILFVAKRWDRALVNGQLVRVHQEDMRQVMGLWPESKYQESGDYAGFLSLAEAVRRYGIKGPAGTDPAMFLAKAAVFNWLVGNCDAHAGNFAVLHAAEGPEFAPLYDIVCTRVYPSLTTELAMRIGGAADAQAVWEEDFALLAEELGLEQEAVLAEAHRQADALRRGMAALPQAEAVADIAAFVEERCADIDCWQNPRRQNPL